MIEINVQRNEIVLLLDVGRTQTIYELDLYEKLNTGVYNVQIQTEGTT